MRLKKDHKRKWIKSRLITLATTKKETGSLRERKTNELLHIKIRQDSLRKSLRGIKLKCKSHQRLSRRESLLRAVQSFQPRVKLIIQIRVQ